MVRTKKQRQGDYGEMESKITDLFYGYEIKDEKKNNKGYDYKRRKAPWWPKL